MKVKAVDDDWEGGFTEWLERYDLARNDRRWLWDRRDAKPYIDIGISEIENGEEWLGSISRDDFTKAIFPGDGEITAWSYYSEVSGDFVESVSISSALVSPERALSLVAALQTTDDPYDYKIYLTSENILKLMRGTIS